MKRLNISAGTITRTVLTFLAFVNAGLEMTGHSVIPVDSEALSTFISMGFMGAMTLISWWKNNSFTQNALKADKIKKGLDTGEVLYNTVSEIINKVSD